MVKVAPHCLSIALLLLGFPYFGFTKDLGVHGPTFSIEEKDLLEVIEAKLQNLSKSGKIAKLNKELIEKVKNSALNPSPTILPTVTEYKANVFDPTFIIKKNLTDHKGTIIAKAGDKINPLDHFKWGSPLLLINGEDEDQINLAKATKAKIVLVQGNPFKITKEMKRRVYFDQAGRIVKHFGIIKVPSKISQKGKALIIEEIPPLSMEVN